MEEKNNFEPEIDFKSLPKSPSRLFGWIFPYYAILFVIVGIYFVKHMDYASLNSVPANYTDSLDINANVEVKRGGIMPAVDLGIISNPSAELVEKGKTLYNTNCSSCHGAEGEGDGVAAAALQPPPRSFLATDGWKNGREFEGIYKTLEKGLPGTAMVAYEFIPVEDRIAIIHHIRTLGEYPAVTDETIVELDNTYDLSKGINTPNNITLEMAASKIVEEGQGFIKDFNKEFLKTNSVDSDALKLFEEYADDKEKAIALFKRDFIVSPNSSEFIDRLISFPTESGFKSSVSLLSKTDLNKLFLLLNNLKG